ncbi:xanthine dehydrogenase family protein subunit M [Natronomonas salina]|uniref:FAD binding domain-containing protein n=1 Tax=Natronomonas salina TaxID=1710540 RepID=UPI0015B547A6|nr:xanthine dehydrogenase family protein subunit M [Natronomonas salina]QLD89143.1 xanthine dehydrogenase family protein subunit M [Natronomonas salina]
MAIEQRNNSEFYRASSFAEAANLLREHDAAIIAGGQSLMPLLRQGVIDKEAIVDVSAIEGHNEIDTDDTELYLGGLATHRELIESDLAETPWDALVETAKEIGDRQVRNWGTIGGSIAHADPSLDYPPTMIALDAEVECSNGETTEYVPLEDFYVAEYVTVLDPDQLVTGVRIPRPPEGSGVAFEKFAWRKGDMSLVNVAVRLSVEGSEITEARIIVGCMGPTPLRMEEMEEALVGSSIDDTERQRAVAEHVDKFTQPVGEEHASVEYKNRLAERLTEKALQTAAERAMEGTA